MSDEVKRYQRQSKNRPSKLKTGVEIEVRDPDDELVTHVPSHVHIERMAEDHWWMQINAPHDSVVVEFTIVNGAHGKRIHSTMVKS